MHLNNPKTIPLPRSVEKLSSIKPVPDVKKIGDHCSRGQILAVSTIRTLWDTWILKTSWDQSIYEEETRVKSYLLCKHSFPTMLTVKVVKIEDVALRVWGKHRWWAETAHYRTDINNIMQKFTKYLDGNSFPCNPTQVMSAVIPAHSCWGFFYQLTPLTYLEDWRAHFKGTMIRNERGKIFLLKPSMPGVNLIF